MWHLDFDGTLLLTLPTGEANAFALSSFYKLQLRRFVQGIAGDTVRFRPSLTYLDYQRIIALMEKEAARRGTNFSVSNTLRTYIEEREMHLGIRSRLGIEIKDRDPKLLERFMQYRTAIDRAMSRPLRDQQAWDSFFMYAMKKSANFSVPGSGKTASVLGVYAFLRAAGEVKRIVVVCPKNAFGSWMDEFTACFAGIEPLRALNIHDPALKNAAQRNAALRYDGARYNLILVNYESVRGVREALRELVDSQSLLVFDEVHKVKKVGGEHAEQALYIAKDAQRVIAMTGTPIPNSYMDIENLLHILYPDEYDEFFRFSTGMLREPHPEEMRQINEKLAPFFCRTTKEQLGVPPASPDEIHRIDASADECRLLRILQMRYRNNKLALLIRLLQMESDPSMLLHALDMRDFQYLLDDSVEPDEIDFADYSQEVKTLISRCRETSKFRCCVDDVETLVRQGKTVVLWCIFVSSICRLAEAFQARGIRAHCVYGEVPLEERQELLRRFRAGAVDVLITNPHTLAESVSLHSICHDAIYFEYSCNLVHLLQSKDRIHRLGLPEGQYTQYAYEQVFYRTDEGEWSLDEAIYQRLGEKERIMLEAIAQRQMEVLPTTAEDIDTIFAHMPEG